VAPHHLPNYIHFGSGQFWHQIIQQWWCKPSFFSTPRQIFHHNWLVWWLIPWSNNQLKWRKWLCSHLHAWLCPKCSRKVQASYAWTMPFMEKQFNTQPLINPLCWMNKQENKYKKYLELFYIMHMLLTQLYYPRSMKIPTSRQNQQKNQWKHADNLWTIYTHILKLFYVLMSVIWFFPWSQMLLPGARWCQELICHTLHSRWRFYIHASNHQVKWSCSCTSENHMWCSSFSLWAEMAGKFMGAQEAIPMLNTLVILGHPQSLLGPPTRLTTQLPLTSSQPKFEWSILKHLTCSMAGSKIRLHKTSLIFSGLVANKTVETISRNTIHWLMICWFTHSTSAQPTMYLSFKVVLVCMHPTHCRPWLHVITNQGIFPPVKT